MSTSNILSPPTFLPRTSPTQLHLLHLHFYNSLSPISTAHIYMDVESKTGAYAYYQEPHLPEENSLSPHSHHC